MTDGFALGGRRFASRLIIGTGKYASFEQNLACAEAAGAEIVTVALRRTSSTRPRARACSTGSRPSASRCFPTPPAVSAPRMR